MTKFSFVIPTKDDTKDLVELLNSIKKQKHKNYEVIIVDASKDGSIKNIAKKYNANFIKEIPRISPSNARNIGWKKAKGEWIVFIDADHFLPQNFLTKSESSIKKTEKICIEPNQIPIINTFIQKVVACEVQASHFFHKSTFPSIVKKSSLKKVKGWDPELGFGDDRDFEHRLKRVGKIEISDDVKTYFKPVNEIRGLVRQARWYGKTMRFFFKKYPSVGTVFNLLIYSSVIPFLIFSLISPIFYWLFIACLFFIIYQTVIMFIIVRDLHVIFIPVIKMIRSSVEIVYILRYFLVPVKFKGRG